MGKSRYYSYMRGFKKDPERFWDDIARSFIWDKPFKRLCSPIEKGPRRWFLQGKINYSENILERNIRKGLTNKEILVFYGSDATRKSYTYGSLLVTVKKLCFFLRKEGVNRRSKVLILLSNESKELSLLLALALQRAGAIFGFLYEGFPKDARDYYVDKVRADFLIYDKDISSFGKKLPKLKMIEKRRLQQGMSKSACWRTVALDASEPTFIVFTSGTTALPKIITSGSLGAFLSTYLFERAYLGFRGNATMINTLNFAFAPTFIFYYASLFLANKTVICEDIVFLAKEAKRIIKAERADALLAIPSFLDKVEHRTERGLTLIFMSEKMSKPQWEKCKRYFADSKIVNICGTAETMAILSSLPMPIKYKKFNQIHFMKPFLGVQYRLSAKDKKGIGKLWIKNLLPSFCSGYLNDQIGFLKRFDKGHLFFDTMDLAKEKRGYLELLGRSDSLLKIKGRYLEPAIIEKEVARLKGIKAAKVLFSFNKIYLCVLAKRTAQREKEINEKICKRVGSYARPVSIYFLKELPKTKTGKIAEQQLWKTVKGISV
ncbi:MAG: AMP-binding protein [Candidatus Omnitrophica bacterium]|nr:AMP-binding protein [Candidatus Omnitrophota bacterium]